MSVLDIESARLVSYWNLFVRDAGLDDRYEIFYALDVESLLVNLYGVTKIEDLSLASAAEFDKIIGSYDDQNYYWYDHINTEIVWLNSALDKDSPAVKYDHYNEFAEYAIKRNKGKRDGR